jgi:hypothetical protein
MALSKEDKGDVKRHLGKALANKVSKVTRDKPFSQHEQTKKNNALMIRMDRKRERNRVAMEAKSKALSKKKSKLGGKYKVAPQDKVGYKTKQEAQESMGHDPRFR